MNNNTYFSELKDPYDINNVITEEINKHKKDGETRIIYKYFILDTK